MKKILCLVLCVAMLLAFVGCGEGSATKGTEGLEYTLLDDGTYAVSVGTATDVTEIVIPSKHEGKAVTKIAERGFYQLTNLTKITIPNTVTSIAAYAFYNCKELTSITIPNSVTSIGYNAFYNCTSLKSITIPNSVTSIDHYAFEFCTSLTSITIPDSVTSIGSSAFNGTAWYESQPDGLVYAGKVAYKYKGTCPNTISIKNDTKAIAGGAFNYCKNLTSITIPDSVTIIGGVAFFYCTSLTSITIPDSVTSIDHYAFYNCTNLTSITYQGTKAEWEKYGSIRWSAHGTIHCTDGDITY